MALHLDNIEVNGDFVACISDMLVESLAFH